MSEKADQVRKDKKAGRFQIVKLEERVAPRHTYHCFYKGHCANCNNPTTRDGC